MEDEDGRDGIDGWVDAAPFRAWLEHLMSAGGLSSAEVAALAGVSARATRALLTGRRGRPVRRICRLTAMRLLSVTPSRKRRWVDAA